MKRLLSLFFNISPVLVFFIGLLMGLLLLLCSDMIGVSHYVNSQGKDTGYAASLNWSVNFTVIVPFVISFIISAIQSLDGVFSAGIRNQMFVTNEYNKTTFDEVSKVWQPYKQTIIKFGSIFFVIAIAISLGEWFIDSYHPLFITNNSSASEDDWAVAALRMDSNKMINCVFAFLAFLYQGVYISFLFLLLIFVAAFSSFISTVSKNKVSIRIIPDIDSADSRKGFQIFQPLAENILMVSVFTFLTFYFSRIQNIYLRSDQNIKSIDTFIKKDLIPFGDDDSLVAFISSPSHLSDFSSQWVSIGTLIIFIVCISLIVFILRDVAIRSKLIIQDLIDQNDSVSLSNITSKSPDIILKSINEMSNWPIKYIGLNTLILLASIAVLCILYYQLGLAMVATAIVALLLKVKKRIVAM